MTVHPFPPLYDKNSKVLILGSFPSVKSREQKFFYGHPQNRFWKVVSAVLGCETPSTVEEKKTFLLEHGIALWDVIASCEITGSSDTSIKNVIPNDISEILEAGNIKQIFVNGKTAEKYYKKAIATRCGSDAFSSGEFEPIYNYRQGFGFIRYNDKDSYIVLVNTGEFSTFRIDLARFGITELENVDDKCQNIANDGIFYIDMPEYSAKVFKKHIN